MDMLEEDQIEALQKAFDSFRVDDAEYITVDNVGVIFKMMGVKVKTRELEEIIREADEDGSGQIEFEEFVEISAKFLIEEDQEALKAELKEAFRIYDRDGVGYIDNDILREILRELDPSLTPENIEDIVEEVDSDGSGTMDFEEFMEMMTG